MQYVAITVRFPPAMRDPLHEVAAYDGVDDLHYMSGHIPRDEDHSYKLFYVEGDPDRVREEAREDDDLLEHYLTPLDDGECYLLAGANTRETNEEWRRVFSDYPLVFVRFDVLDAERKRIAFLSETVDPGDVLEDLPDEMDVTVEAVRDFCQPPGAMSCALTQRQYEALAVAAESGYYEVPRETSLDEVAGRLDCSESTASTLLRRAESQLVDRMVMG